MLSPSGIALRQLTEEHPEGIVFGEREYDLPEKFRTPSGKIELHSPTLAELGEDPIPVHKEPTQSPARNPALTRDYPCVLMTGARIPEYTHWQMKNIPQLRKLAPDAVAWIHPDTAQAAGVADGEMIFVETRRGKIKVKAGVTRDMMMGVVSLTHGWEEEANANNLTELDARDSITGYSEFRNLACRIRSVAKVHKRSRNDRPTAPKALRKP